MRRRGPPHEEEKNAKKPAVARKLAVLLHRLCVSREVYGPLRNSQKAMSAAAQRVLRGALMQEVICRLLQG